MHLSLSDSSAAEQEASDATELARATDAAAQPRVITAEQIAKLIALMSDRIAGKVIVKANMPDYEAATYADEIQNALKAAAGAELVELGYTGVISLYKKGGAILVKDWSNPPPHGAFVQKCVAQIGVNFPATEADSEAEFPADAIVIWLGRK